MIIVNSIMPSANTMMPTVRLPAGITPPTIRAMTSPTPAASKIAPRLASSIGSMHNGPIADSSRSESPRNTAGVLARLNAHRMIAETNTPMQQPASAPMAGISAPATAKTPMASAGMNTFCPMRRKLPSTSASVGSAALPGLTRWAMAGMTMMTMSRPSIIGGIQRPKAMTTPSSVQKTKVP